jgi:hypothetical protein
MIEANGATFKSRSVTLALSAAVPLRNDGHGGVTAEFVLSEGKSQVFILRDDCNQSGVPCPPSEEEAERLLRGTVKFWQGWLSTCTYHGRWRDQVHRSALALKLLTFERLFFGHCDALMVIPRKSRALGSFLALLARVHGGTARASP